jgi:signal transduction histidine kinase
MSSALNYSLASLGLGGRGRDDFDNAGHLCSLMMECPIAVIAILEYEAEAMFFAAAYGTQENFDKYDRVSVENMICRYAMRDDCVLAIPDCRSDARTKNDRMVRDGKVVGYAAAPIRDSNGDPVGALCCADAKVRNWSDTERLKLTRLARCVEDIIKLRIATSTEERANRRLNDEAKTRSAFLSHVVHEIRTPLTSIVGPLFMLEGKDLGGDVGNLVAISSKAVRRLIGFLDTALDFARIDEGHFVVEKEPLDIAELVNGVLENHRQVAATSEIELRVRNLLGRTVYETDRSILETALDRLVGNALKFTGRGYVEVELRPHRRSGIRIDVVDTGVGIARERQDVLFDEFEQAGPNEARTGGGTGLGMALLKRQLMLLDADVHVSSEPDVGSRFTILLPVERHIVTTE